jgi:mitogen-activated protein kinase organizer 1
MMSFGLILCKEPVTSVKLSNDTNCVLLSCLDSHLRLLDKSNGDILNDYSGHKNEVYALRSCFSYDDAYVISGSENNQILFWDLVEVCARL